MITKMDKRFAGVVALLGLAFASVSRPALAQDGNSWFDDGTANDQPPAPPPATQSAPPRPLDAPQPQVPYGAPPVPGPQAPTEQDNVPETDPSAITDFRPTLD
ncbi:MAG: hypothetical protein ABW061_04805, partial [Polyangiaceae bacterium]